MKTAFEMAYARTIKKMKIFKKFAEKEAVALAVQRGGSVVRDKLLKEIHDLKELITNYEENLGAVNMYLKQAEYSKALLESNRFIDELDKKNL